MLRVCKIGHGATIPNIGDTFFLKIGWYLGRPLFPPASIRYNGERFRVYYSVRSTNSLLDFQIGQVWEVEVVRLRRSVKNGKIITIARLDLLAYRDALMGHFDYRTKTWQLCKETTHGLIDLTKEKAYVRYSEYVRVITKGEDVQYVIGYFPEVVDTTGVVLMRYSPQSTREIDACECVNYIALPDDNVPFTNETDVWKLQKLFLE